MSTQNTDNLNHLAPLPGCGTSVPLQETAPHATSVRGDVTEVALSSVPVPTPDYDPTAPYDEQVDTVDFHFDLSPTRRDFINALGVGLLIVVTATSSRAQTAPQRAEGGNQRRGGGGGRGNDGARTIKARVHIAPDGALTVLTGKVEGGQGGRAQHTQAAAEELRVDPSMIKLVMADTALTPDDGGTFGSRSTPGSVPAVRRGCAAARQLLTDLAAKQWNVDAKSLTVDNGKITNPATGRSVTYADLAKTTTPPSGVVASATTSSTQGPSIFDAPIPPDVELTPVDAWKTMGKPLPRPGARDIVTGKHEYPSDIKRPGMLYGKVLRSPTVNGKLLSINTAAAKNMKGVTIVQDTNFVGAVAPTSFAAKAALDAIAPTAKWETAPHPASSDLSDHLRKTARDDTKNRVAGDPPPGGKSLRQTYHVPYIQHAPLEPRAAVAEWEGADKLTVWAATQNPFRVRDEVARAFNLPPENVRIIVPDFGGGFGGKHSGETDVEAARLAKAVGKPVSLRWTRKEEFTWAYFRPAAVIDMEATLDNAGRLASWHHLNINSGANEIDPPYAIEKKDCRFVPAQPPLRHGSYRALATTANNFARESFVDELAHLAGKDPLAFRLAHLDKSTDRGARMTAVLEAAAKKFDWPAAHKAKKENTGVGIACGYDKGSYVATIAQILIDPSDRSYKVTKITTAYDCGKIINPANLLAQVTGGILQGLGAALREEMRFENGKILNPSFGEYQVPQFSDLPDLDTHLLDRPDLPSVGAGETPIIAIAPAIANAVFHATTARTRSMPIKLPDTNPA